MIEESNKSNKDMSFNINHDNKKQENSIKDLCTQCTGRNKNIKSQFWKTSSVCTAKENFIQKIDVKQIQNTSSTNTKIQIQETFSHIEKSQDTKKQNS